MKFLISLFSIFCIIFASCSNNSISKPPRAKKGILDLSHWKFEKDGIATLSGEWEMYWNQFIDPDDFKDSSHRKNTVFFDIPRYWNGMEINGKKIDGTGFATFRLKFIIPKDKSVNIISIKEILSSYKCWLNGKLVAENGRIGKTKEQAIPLYVPTTISFVALQDTNEIVLQSSNYFHRKGGFFEEIQLGSYEKVTSSRTLSIAFDLFLFGSLLIMALYHFGLFALRRKESSTLYFGLLALFVAFRLLVTREQFFSIFLPDLSWEINYKIEYLTFFMAPPFFLLFFKRMFPEELNKYVVRASIGLGLTFSVLAIFTKASVYSYSSNIYQIIILIGIVFVTIGMIKALIKKRDGALLLFLGVIILMVTTVNDILYIQGLIKTVELASIGLFVFILCQSFVLSHRFSKAYIRNEELSTELEAYNRDLEKTVKERTHEILQQNEEIQAQATQLEMTNKELEKLSIVAQQTDNAVTIANEQGVIEWVNGGFVKLFGFTLEQYIKEKGGNILKSEFHENILEEIIECMSSKTSIVFTSCTKTREDEKIWIQTTLTPIVNNEGNVVKLVAIDSNITQVKEAEAAINQQNEEIKAQHEQLTEMNDELQKMNEAITDSISYAKLIQDAILPREKNIKHYFPDSFILYKPRDIVSGDFYWFSKQENYLFIAGVDCTGHGVPGGFMSMIGHSLLNEIVNEKKILTPSVILDRLNWNIINILHQGDKGVQIQDDGMDITLCRIDLDKQEIQIASANQRVYIIHENEMKTINGDIYSIGEILKQQCEQVYENHIMELKPNTMLYMFSDGYQDQFGGPNNKKFRVAQFEELLKTIHNKPMDEQKEILGKTHLNWKSSHKQKTM